MLFRIHFFAFILIFTSQFTVFGQSKNIDTIPNNCAVMGPLPDSSLFKIDTTQIEDKIEKLAITADEIPCNDLYKYWNNDYVRLKKKSINEIIKSPTTIILLAQGRFVFPFKGKIISPFGYRGRGVHTGTDIKLNKGDTVLAAFDGVVRLSKRYSGYGKTVVIRHYNGLETIYSHLSKLGANVNQKVKAGDFVGLGGRTGRASTEHLHFEIRYLEEPFNPQHIIDFSTFTLYDSLFIITRKTFKMRAKPIHKKGLPAEIYEDDNLKSDSLDTLYAHNWIVPKVDSLAIDSAKLDTIANSSNISPKDSTTTIKKYKPKRNFVGPPIDTILVVKLKNNDKIKGKETIESNSKIRKQKIHKVVAKDTFYSISKKYKISIEKLCSVNKLEKNSILSIGQELIIPN
jgi:LysM repeat protein